MIISEMQHKLATWAEEDQTRRFDRLLRLITNRTWLAEAARIVLASRGARTPGIDGIDKQRLQESLDKHLDQLQVDLLQGKYRPQPVKRIYIDRQCVQNPSALPSWLGQLFGLALCQPSYYFLANSGYVVNPLLACLIDHPYPVPTVFQHRAAH